ncbi:dihydropteridine reductase [Caulobacter sp. Root1455]|uniref:NO-inducible flavohemoprotein n=1 Tax=unclassified Caulobacter TaxID=2648921 RepID=UPI0006F81BA5|nr:MULTISPECIES: NO-inducible flavohemoprotein [unclassified Caulobacter]KQY28752.1 dihydropteridine reductase [Caulobacter sp. Root487D2Y]KQY98910.1 dihydropteridine reductase [Caulobacter sp. Root1455]
MAAALSADTITRVKATAPALAEHGVAITLAMYARLFQDDHIKALFNHANQSSGAQPKALAGAVLAYAQNIDNLGVLLPAVERIAQKHVGYHILAEHYPFVATALLGAIKDVLGDAATDEILAAWGEAFWFLADILIDREARIRAEIEAVDGGWTGWRDFVVAEKIRESAVITSFVLRPKDGGPVIPHKPGQYLTFRFDLPDAPQFSLQGEKRNYSISAGPNDESYRISVKREDLGAASRFLHDQIRIGDILQATPPAGDFFLADRPDRPVVLLSGGVGLTPMVSMVEHIAKAHPELEAHFVHGALNSRVHALDGHVRTLAKDHGGVSVTTFYSEPLAGDRAGQTHDVDGLITLDWLKANTPFDQADFYLCGPKPFLRTFVDGLAGAGVPADRIHYEFFGPTDEALAA